MKPVPFSIKRENGIVWIDAKADAAFRQALMDGVPVNLRAKMREALAATPDKGAMAHSIRYFGSELEQIKAQIAPLMMELNRMLSESFNLPGLYDWIDATNYGNDYRMIKVFKAWSEMVLSKRPSIPGPGPDA
jgi:hypothetical protein